MTCSHPAVEYSDKYDSYYCPACDVWTERACSDPSCSFCSKRPVRPSDATEED